MSRIVVLSGTAQLNLLIRDPFNYEAVIKDALTNAGFTINAVRVTQQTFFSNAINITIESYVNDEFSAEQQRVGIENALANIAGQSYVYYNSPLLSNVNLSILSDGQAATINHDTTDQNALQSILDSIGNAALDVPKDFAKNSITPIAIAALAIFAVIYFIPRHR